MNPLHIEFNETKMVSEREKILGVDNEILINFLILIRDRYEVADDANFFLEVNTGESGINIGITNQRDVLSHLVTLLKSCNDGDGLPVEDQQAQLTNAEEHFRRAILEPYEYSVDLKIEEFKKAYETFRRRRHVPFAAFVIGGIPERTQIDGRISAIKRKRAEARSRGQT